MHFRIPPIFSAILFISLFLLYAHTHAIAPAAATTVYVDAVNGSNVTGNGTAVSPWRTITHALTRVSGGDTIQVKPGTYNSALGETFPINLSSGISLVGSGRDTTKISGQSDEPVVMLGIWTTDIFSNTVISGLTLQDGDIGLMISAYEGHVVSPHVSNVRIYHNAIGLFVNASGEWPNRTTVTPMITRTEVLSNSQLGIRVQSGDHSTAAPVIANSTVQGNLSHGVYAEGFRGGSNAAPILIGTRISGNGEHGIATASLYEGSAGPRIQDSLIVNNAGYGLSLSGGANNSKLSNAVVAHNASGGIQVGAKETYQNGSVEITNSTIAQNAGYGIYWGQFPSANGLAIFNSIVWNVNADDLYMTSDEGWTTSQVINSIVEDGDLDGQEGNSAEDPRLLDDFHLSPCSPAIDAGVSVGAPDTDIEGERRPAGAAPDIGADETDAPCLLESSKEASTAQARLSDVLTYTIKLTNTTTLTPLNVLMTDVLPASLIYVPDSAQASQGSLTYSSGELFWSDEMAPSTVITLSLQAKVTRANNDVLNSITMNTGTYGIYRSPASKTFIEPERVYLPILGRNYCAGPIVDDFNYAGSGWPIAETTAWSYGYSDGEYRFYAKRAAVGLVTRGDRQYGTVIIEVDARQKSAINGSLGIMFGLDNTWEHFYTFEVYPATQEYAAFEYRHGSWVVQAYGSSSAILPGQNVNHFRVVSDANYFVTYLDINGTVVSIIRMSYGRSESRRFGLTATSDGEGFEAHFDNFKYVPDSCPENPTQQINSAPLANFETERDIEWGKR